MNKRNISPKKDEDYDEEKGERVYFNNNVNTKYRLDTINNYINILLKIGLLLCIFIVIYVAKLDIDNAKSGKNSIRRKLIKNQIEIDTTKCSHLYTHPIKEYMDCITKDVPILVVSDTIHDKEEVLQHIDLKKYEMGFLHINYFLFGDKNQEFLDNYTSKSPWIFLEGKYIGGFKDLIEYHDYNVIDDGFKKSPFTEHINYAEEKREEEKILNEELKKRNNLKPTINFRDDRPFYSLFRNNNKSRSEEERLIKMNNNLIQENKILRELLSMNGINSDFDINNVNIYPENNEEVNSN